VENQRAEIQTLTQRVAQLNDQVIEGQMSCTNKFVQREQEILIMISSLEAEAQKTNGKITVLEDKRNENRFGGDEEPDGDNGTGGTRPKVSMMRIQEPVVQTKTIIKTDNTNMLKMISKVKKDVNDHIPK
jgi:hypothetical protein